MEQKPQRFTLVLNMPKGDFFVHPMRPEDKPNNPLGPVRESFNNLYEEIESCRAIISNNWGLDHNKKIYDVSSALRKINVGEQDAAEKELLTIIKSHQTIYYAGQMVHKDIREILEAKITQLRRQLGNEEPFVILFSNHTNLNFNVLKKLWAKNSSVSETILRFLAAFVGRIFSRSAWLSPSTGVMMFLLIGAVAILFPQVLLNIFNQTIVNVLMGIAWSGLLFAGPLFLRFIYKDYDRCAKAHKNPNTYNFFTYLGEISYRLNRWADKNFFQSVIVGIGVAGSCIAFFLTIAFFTNGFVLFPGVFEFMSPVFSFLQTAMPIVFPGELLSVQAANIAVVVISSVAFIIMPFFTAISIQRFISTLIEAGDRSVDPYYQDAPKGERKLLGEPYPWQIHSYKPVLDVVDNSFDISKQYNDDIKPVKVSSLPK